MRLPAEYYSSIRKRNVQFCECNIKIRFHILKPELSRAFAIFNIFEIFTGVNDAVCNIIKLCMHRRTAFRAVQRTVYFYDRYTEGYTDKDLERDD